MVDLKHKPLIAEILSGFLMLGLLAITFFDKVKSYYLSNTQTPQVLFNAGALILAAWIIGTFFDAFRNGIIESLIDGLLKDNPPKMNWDFFFRGEREKVAQFDEYYWAYYQLDMDLVIAIFWFLITLFIIYCTGFECPYYIWITVCSIILAIIFGRDAWVLREDIRRLIHDEETST